MVARQEVGPARSTEHRMGSLHVFDMYGGCGATSGDGEGIRGDVVHEVGVGDGG